MSLEVGDTAPAFKLSASGGKTVKLSEFKGRKVVLYFYPKDNTSGCTAEACAFRDTIADYHKQKVVILGVSPDSEASHDKFTTQFELPFTLLSDPTHEVSTAYGVWQEKSMYGRKYMGIVRTTFIINEKGKITHIFPKVKVAGHTQEVLSALTEEK